MKKYSVAFLIYAGVLCLVYYSSYRLTYDYYKEENKEQTSEVGEAVLADTSKEPILKADTEYVVEKYNRRSKVKTEEKSQIPTILLGMNREAVLEYVDEYVKDPSLDELEQGFEDMELIAFSSERVVFHKTYMPWEKAYKYSLGVAGGDIVVYYLDHKTVYEYTDIYLNDLPEAIQIAIRKEECRMDVHELYEFLENYSS